MHWTWWIKMRKWRAIWPISSSTTSNWCLMLLNLKFRWKTWTRKLFIWKTSTTLCCRDLKILLRLLSWESNSETKYSFRGNICSNRPSSALSSRNKLLSWSRRDSSFVISYATWLKLLTKLISLALTSCREINRLLGTWLKSVVLLKHKLRELWTNLQRLKNV